MSGCKTCGIALGARNKSGYCKRHISAANAADPVWREKQKTGSIRALQGDPGRLARLREIAAINGKSERSRQQLSRFVRENRTWELGHAALAANPKSRKLAARRASATKLAWCPPELRQAYRDLIYSKRLLASEAREIILAQHEADMSRFRAKLGVSPEPEQWTPPTVNPELAPFDRAIAVAAAFCGLEPEQVTEANRGRPYTRARWVVMVALRRAGWVVKAIADELNIADHSTVVYGLKEANALIATDEAFASACDAATAERKLAA